MRIAERMHLVAPNILWNEITITDPVTLEKPWTVTYAYRRMPDYTLLEYVCEDNREFADQGFQKSTSGEVRRSSRECSAGRRLTRNRRRA